MTEPGNSSEALSGVVIGKTVSAPLAGEGAAESVPSTAVKIDGGALVARVLQSMHPDRLGQHAGLLAHHYAAANWAFEARRWQRRAALRVTSIEVPKPRRR